VELSSPCGPETLAGVVKGEDVQVADLGTVWSGEGAQLAWMKWCQKRMGKVGDTEMEMKWTPV
jgi:hypothetical protein